MMPITGPSLPISQIKWKPAKVEPSTGLPGSTGRRVEHLLGETLTLRMLLKYHDLETCSTKMRISCC